MITIKEINTSNEHYPFLEALMHTAFPIQERRNDEEQRYNTDYNPLFHSNLIIDNNTLVGLINYWDFKTFRYIEHFAIDNNLRSKGYGKTVITRLKEESKLPIVLEVEEPIDEITQRRISFYQRQGFILDKHPYLQPPYRKGDSWFPLCLMSYGTLDMDKHFDNIKSTIYKEVYRVDT